MQADPSDKSRSRKKSPLRAAVSGGMELAVALILGVFAGRKADDALGTEPFLLLLGVAAGFSVGLYLLVRSAKQPSSNGQKRD
jgi:F0F1-type ATP synthase assembly protein I